MPHNLKDTVEVLSLVRRVPFSLSVCEQIEGSPVPQVATHLCARCAEHSVAVPVPLNLKENDEVVNLPLHQQISEIICVQIVGVPIPQVAEQLVTRLVVVPVPHNLEETTEVVGLAPRMHFFKGVVNRSWESPFHKSTEQFAARLAHVPVPRIFDRKR